MTRITRRPAYALTMLVAMAALCWFALGCGLFNGDQREPSPTPEPDIQATISAALQSAMAAQQAAQPTAAPTPEPTATPAPSEAPAAADGGELADVLATIGPDARWGDLFVAFTASEQSCISSELGEEPLAVALASPIFHHDDTPEWEVAIFDCLGQESAVALFHSIIVTRMSQEVELTAENTDCMQSRVADADVPALVAGSRTDATAQQAEALFEFFFGLSTCIPELMASGPGAAAAEDETRLWTFVAGGWVSAAPKVVDDVVYVGSDDHRVYALDAAAGSELWSFATGDAVHSAPTVADGVVYVGSNDNRLYALDAATGNMLWSHDTGAWVQYSPTVNGGMVYLSVLVGGEPRIVALDAASGALVWTARQPHAADPAFTPTVVGGLVYEPGAEYGVFRALDVATGEIAWTASVGSYVESAPTVLGGVVYLTVVNEAYALDELTGEVIWSYGTERYPARDFPALVVEGVYYLSPDEFLHALDASTGEPIWTHQAAAPISAAPVVADGAVFAATEAGQVFAVDAATGAELWTLPTEGMGLQGLTVADGVLYAESDLGNLLAVDAAGGSLVREFQKAYIWGVRTYAVRDGVVYFGSFPSGVSAYAAPEPR